MSIERRADLREALQLPVMLMPGGRGAVTRDISRHGVFVALASGPPLAGTVRFEFDLPAMKLRFVAEGRVVRTERTLSGVGCAVAFSTCQVLPRS